MLLLVLVLAAAPQKDPCDKGDGAKCLENARALLKGQETSQKDATRALELAQKACKAKVAGGCTLAGQMNRLALGTDKNENKGRELLSKGCELKDGAACNDLGTDASEGKHGAPTDLRAAQGFYAKACEYGDGLGCFNLGNVYRLGEGVEKDPKKAAEAFEKACDHDEAAGCTELGVSFYEGSAGEKNPDRARELFARGCKLGSQVSCRNAGLIKKEKE